MTNVEWTKKLTEDVTRICGNTGVTPCPVKINPRLSRTLGRVIYLLDKTSENYYPDRMEFSAQFLARATEKEIEQVMLHETAHLITFYRYGEKHGHDACFKKVCAEIGCVEDKTSIVTSAPAPENYKYQVYCPDCGATWNYKIRGVVVKNADRYACSCGCAGLKVRNL